MKKTPLLLIILSLLILVGTFIYFHSNLPKTAYIINGEIFDGFNGKKELEAKLQNDRNQKQLILDSLQMEIVAMEQQLKESPKDAADLIRSWQSKKDFFLKIRKEYDQQMLEKESTFTAQTWQQINTYIKEYGTENNYDYIHGAGGNGNLMYAHEAQNITAAVLHFINGKYDGN